MTTSDVGYSMNNQASCNSLWGPWKSGPHNPLLISGVEDEVHNTGHADLVEDQYGRWWAVLLAVRPVRTINGWEHSVFGKEFLITIPCKARHR